MQVLLTSSTTGRELTPLCNSRPRAAVRGVSSATVCNCCVLRRSRSPPCKWSKPLLAKTFVAGAVQHALLICTHYRAAMLQGSPAPEHKVCNQKVRPHVRCAFGGHYAPVKACKGHTHLQPYHKHAVHVAGPHCCSMYTPCYRFINLEGIELALSVGRTLQDAARVYLACIRSTITRKQGTHMLRHVCILWLPLTAVAAAVAATGNAASTRSPCP